MNPAPESSNPFLSPQNSPRSIPKTVGVLNIVFASLMLLGGGCGGLYILALSVMGPLFEQQQNMMHSEIAKEREDKLTDLAADEQAAATEDERVEIQARRKQLEDKPIPQMPNMSKLWSSFSEPRIMGFLWTDLLSGLLLNLGMFIAGIGLLNRRSWARNAAVWIAGIKIVRLVALYSFYIVAVVPVSVKMLIEFLSEFTETGAGGMDPAGVDTAAKLTMQYTAYAIAMIVVGSIYPIVTLWLLTRPQAKAVCNK